MSSSDDVAGTGEADVDVEVDVNPIMHIIAPIAAIAVTMVVRSALNKGYERTTGKKPPLPRDPRTSAMQAIMWTAVITTTAAIAEVAVYRIINKVGAQRRIAS
jgi:hypothetical protein